MTNSPRIDGVQRFSHLYQFIVKSKYRPGTLPTVFLYVSSLLRLPVYTASRLKLSLPRSSAHRNALFVFPSVNNIKAEPPWQLQVYTIILSSSVFSASQNALR